MNRLPRQSLYFYLSVGTLSLSLLVGSLSTLIIRMGSLGLSLALCTIATLLAAVAYGRSTPLGKERCKPWFVGNLVMFGAFVALFVVADFFRFPVSYTQGNLGGYTPMAIVCTVISGVCILGLCTVVLRAISMATGHLLTDADRRAMREFEAETQQAQTLQPRAIDQSVVVTKAQQELSANRVVTENEPMVEAITPQKLRKQRASQTQSKVAKQPQPTVDEQPEIEVAVRVETRDVSTEPPTAPIQSTPQEPKAAPVVVQKVMIDENPEPIPAPAANVARATVSPKEVRNTYVPHEDSPAKPIEIEQEEEDEIPAPMVYRGSSIGAEAFHLDDADRLMPADSDVDHDLRAEVATHHTRQAAHSDKDDLYSDFSYSNDDN